MPPEGEQGYLEAAAHAGGEIVHALDVALVHAAGGFMRAAGIQVKQPLGELQRMRSCASAD